MDLECPCLAPGFPWWSAGQDEPPLATEEHQKGPSWAVELVIYDLSTGCSAMNLLGAVLLPWQSLSAIYHTGVLVYGREYWYGGQLFSNHPVTDKVFGPPIRESEELCLEPSEYVPGLRVVRLGRTREPRKFFESHLNWTLSKKYTPASYDILTNNCNHFASEAVEFLCESRVPEAVMHVPKMLMNAPLVRLLRPLLNRRLGGCDNKEDCSWKEEANRTGPDRAPIVFHF
jgi:hypothetical protein